MSDRAQGGLSAILVSAGRPFSIPPPHKAGGVRKRSLEDALVARDTRPGVSTAGLWGGEKPILELLPSRDGELMSS